MNPGEPQLVRVLIVEDNPDDRDLLIRQLARIQLDEQVKFIADGREALDFLTTGKAACDLIAIFLDLKLPSLSGLDLLRQIKSRPHLKEISIIIMTLSLHPQDLKECQRLEVTHFIAKPIILETFTKAVAEIFHLPVSS